MPAIGAPPAKDAQGSRSRRKSDVTLHSSAKEQRLLLTSMVVTIVLALTSIGFGLWISSKSVMFDGFYDLIDAAMTGVAAIAFGAAGTAEAASIHPFGYDAFMGSGLAAVQRPGMTRR